MKMRQGFLALSMLAVSAASAGTVTVANRVEGENASPAVAKAIASLKDGDTLKFEKGEYHFHIEGTTRKYIVSSGLNVGNFTTTMYLPTVVELTVTEKRDDGFLCRFLDPKCYKVENGHIVFDLDIGRFSTADDKISIHALDRCCIEYLFAGDTKASKVHLPAGHMVTNAEDRGDGMVFFRYRSDDGSEATQPYFDVGEAHASV